VYLGEPEAMKTTSRRGILLASGWLIIFFLLAPSLIVFPISLTDTSYLGLPEHGFLCNIGERW